MFSSNTNCIPSPSLTLPPSGRGNKRVAAWLFLCAALVALMVAVGGYTRLSGSGLSITEWKPIHGVIPPLDAAQWEEEFAAYRATPQYAKINSGMTLAEFKTIFWPEFLHRLLGRTIGLVFLLPFLWFAMRRHINKRFTWRLLGIFALGGLQGVVGWYMVKSGMVNDPYVSHIRLCLHLSLALVLLALLLWSALDSVTPRLSWGDKSLWFIFALLCCQIILGALLAGLHGGLIYNTFPTMNGVWVAPEVFAGGFFYNLAAIQFVHRWLAVIIILSYGFWWFRTRAYAIGGPLGILCASLPLVAFSQVILGIFTLLLQAPLPLALAHQCVGVLLFALTIIVLHAVQHANTH